MPWKENWLWIINVKTDCTWWAASFMHWKHSLSLLGTAMVGWIFHWLLIIIFLSTALLPKVKHWKIKWRKSASLDIHLKGVVFVSHFVRLLCFVLWMFCQDRCECCLGTVIVTKNCQNAKSHRFLTQKSSFRSANSIPQCTFRWTHISTWGAILRAWLTSVPHWITCRDQVCHSAQPSPTI